jgi:hypothetical protein
MPRVRISLLLGTLAVLAMAAAGAWVAFLRPSPAPPVPTIDPSTIEATRVANREGVEKACTGCHGYPPPEIFPKADWPREVTRGMEFLSQSGSRAPVPTMANITKYYQDNAPETLPIQERLNSPTPFPVRFERLGYRPLDDSHAPGIANVRFVALTDKTRLDVVACDMMNGKVLLLKPYEPSARTRVINDTIPNPAHAEVVDLDRDGIKDLIVANLGSPLPTERRVGSVVWLRGRPDGSFAPITLADELGRLTDVQAADFDGDGDLDLVVAEFGRLAVGSILLLENRTKDVSVPIFVRSTIDKRHGTIHVPVADLNGDGKPDFVALISQEHEAVVAFVNKGDRKFEAKDIYRAPHPGFGSSGIQLVDLDKDGDLDVLMSNGDTLDADLLRPYHGVQWLENKGTFPYEYHHLTPLYGVHRAMAADFDRDGDMDIVATSFMPGSFYQPLCREMKLDAVILLEQTKPGTFVRRSLEDSTCDHATCDIGDFDGDGNLDFVTGNLLIPNRNGPAAENPGADWIIVEKNCGKAR